jgi:hypothetical protein
MAKKEVIYQGLSDLNVLIDDTTQYSPDYFRVTNLPGEFTAGINVFKFKGNPALFPENSPLYIEVLDANGLPVYYEIGLDLESQEQSAIISVYINEDTVPGNGSITICGQANQSSEGQILDASEINVRWSGPVYIDISKRNVDDIIFDELPVVTITATTGSYTNLGYPSNTRTESATWSNISYIYRNDEATLYTSSLSFPAFPSTATNTTVTLYYGDIADVNQRTNEEIYTTAEFTSSISTYSGSGIAYLTDPIIFTVNNSSEQHIVQSGVINTMDVVYEQSASLASQSTENTHNIAVVQFSGLQPQVGEISKIRSYYKSAGVQEYIFSNETDISDLADEFGFTANIVTASFVLPTIHRNDRFDFKFEFINPSGYISKQTLEYRDVLFLGGNTYIGGEDNLITGSLYVAGATGTGVHISGKGNAAMIRSIGYEGFSKALQPGGKGGFVIYSGSVQPLLNASENYSGVGIELVANSSSYFKYKTANGGLLDIKTEDFFLGGENQFISGNGGNIVISSSNFSINQAGNTAMSGDVNAVNGIFQNALITGFVITGSGTAYEKASGLSSAFLLESWFTSSYERNLASGISSSSLTTKFATGGQFNYGIFGWTASLTLSASAKGYTSTDGATNPLGYGYNMAGARYLGASQFEPKANNPGAPFNFLKWKQITGEYGAPYNGYGNEVTASVFGGTFACAPTVDSVIFLSPPFGNNIYSITSSLLTIPSASLGYAFDPTIQDFTYNTNPISLQFSMRMMAAKAGGGTGIGTNKWSTNSLYKTYYGQVEIFDENNNILLTERKYFAGSDDWQTFNLPLTPALAVILTSGLLVYNKFKIVISWKHSDPEPFYGKYFPTTSTNLVRITELRIVQSPVTLGLKTDSLQFQDSFLSSGNSGTQHYGSFYPLQHDTYDLGTDRQHWKSIYVNSSSLGIATIEGGIKNPTVDPFGYDNKYSLIVWDGLSNVNHEIYNPALTVNYDGDVSMYKKVMIGQGGYTNYWSAAGALTISGSVMHAPPGNGNYYNPVNEFSGELWPFNDVANGNFNSLGDIFFLSKDTTYPGQYLQQWERASAKNVNSGSGMLGLNVLENYAGQPYSFGIRGQANFTSSVYQTIKSASGVLPGDKLYLSTTPGKFQNWAPTGSGEIVRIIGYCTNYNNYYWNSGSIYFAPETSWIENV